MSTTRTLIGVCFVAVVLFQAVVNWRTLSASSSSRSSKSLDCNCHGNKGMAGILVDPGRHDTTGFGPPPRQQPRRSRTDVDPPPPPPKKGVLTYPPGRKYLTPTLSPKLGHHRPDANAIIAMATGYEIDDHLQMVGSLLATNYTGDIVLGIQKLDQCTPALQTFLQYHARHSNLVAYEIGGCHKNLAKPSLPRELQFGHARCTMQHAYRNPYTEKAFMPTDYSGRHQSARKFRYEYYWIWQLHYSSSSKILLADFRDLVFQSNPFEHHSLVAATSGRDFSTTLYLYEESALRRITETHRFTGDLMVSLFGQGMVDAIGNQTVICSGVTLGGKLAIEQYLLIMIWDMDNFLNNKNGQGDQVHHNIVYYTGQLSNQTNIETVKVWKNMEGAVATLGYTYKAQAQVQVSKKSLQPGQPLVLLNDGSAAPIVHQFDRVPFLLREFKQKRDTEWQVQAEKLTGQSMFYKPKSGEKKPS